MTLLPWLPSLSDPAATLRATRALPDASERLRGAIALAGHARDTIATGRIDRLATEAIDIVSGDQTPGSGLTPMRLAILGSHTVDHLVPAIRVAGLSRNLAISVHVGEYGQFRSSLLGDDAELARFAPQLILLTLDVQALIPPLPLSANRADAGSAVAQAIAEARGLWSNIRSRYGAQPLQQTLLSQVPPLVGSNEGLLPASPNGLCARLNEALRHAAIEDNVLLVDVADRMPPADGDDRLYDPVRWHQAKQLINPVFAPLYGDLVARVIAAVAGRSRKALVLDLDNTLWGGVIGDDGLDHIRLGQGSAEGEAFLAFQRYIAWLGARGIILAVCSKNDEAVAKAAFEGHPEMQIAMKDVACFVANWSDKASNVRRIAQALNIGLDSLVFVDDNPAERAIIRREIPEVAVPELPDDVAFYPEILAAAGYFETAAFTSDDFGRTDSYAANAERASALNGSTDLEGFLVSLDMTLGAGRISAIDRARAAQLINKTNQFNLTTRRRTEEELAAVQSDPDAVALSFRLRDRFGDNGLISVIIARRDLAWQPDEWLIDTWLMSCRVLGRGVEIASLQILRDTASKLGGTALIGEYRSSGRNLMVEQHYEKLGFEPIRPKGSSEADVAFWRLDLPGPQLPKHQIKVEILG